MQYRINHTTEYLYEEAVGFTPQLIRLFPRSDPHIRILDYQLKVFPSGDLYWFKDSYDNVVAKFFTTETSRQLSISVTAVIDQQRTSAFDFLLDTHAITFPFQYTETERQILALYLASHSKPSFISEWIESSGADLTGETTACLNSILSKLHHFINYQRRDKPGIQSAEKTLQTRSGTCRDYAVLFMSICSHFHLATRFVSGYLYTEKGDSSLLGSDSLHAWVEIYLPGAGWRGLDPTNGIWCGQCHIPLAISQSPQDTTPIEGTYCANHEVLSKLKTSLRIQNPSCNDSHK